MIEPYSFLWWIYSAIAFVLYACVVGLSLTGWGMWLGAPFWCEPFTKKEREAQRRYGI